MIGVDTNIALYAFDDRDPAKRKLARSLLRNLSSGSEPSVLIWQVLGEFVSQLRRWQSLKWIDESRLRRNVAWLRRLFPVVIPNPAVIDRALDLVSAHTLSHWDSMLVAACLEAGVDTLYTEDMGAPRTIESLKLVNPFAAPPAATP